jgi:hypothetical protein
VTEERDPVTIVEAAYRVWNADGPHAFAGHVTDQVQLHDAPDLPDAQVWAGRDSLVARLEEVVATTGGRWADVDDVRPVAGEVLVSLTWRFERDSPETLASVYHVVRVEGERIDRIRVFLDEAEAVRAAGG